MTESLYRLLTSSSSLISFLASDHLCDEQLKLSVFNEYLVLLNIVLCNQQLEWTDFEPFNQQLISLVSDYLVHIVNNFTLSTMIKRDLKTICQGSQVSLEEYLEYLRTTPFLTSTSPNGLYTRFVIHSVMYLMLNKYTIGTLLGEKLGFIWIFFYLIVLFKHNNIQTNRLIELDLLFFGRNKVLFSFCRTFDRCGNGFLSKS